MSISALAAGFLVTLTRLITGVRARWAGAAPSQAQQIFFANHSSHLDALTIWAALPPELRERTRPVAAADYWDRDGARGWLARLHLSGEGMFSDTGACPCSVAYRQPPGPAKPNGGR